ncbi:MAG: response regulator [Saprospiraceae bacterium]|nr:response regulator [Saprospiraceae bacterium]
MRVFIRDILADKFRVIEAADGQEGLEKALEHIPDLIVSDVMMPRMDGLELCDALKNDERSSHIPIVLLTAKADLDSRIAGLRRGADDYLAKPFHREELLLRAGNLLLQRQRLRERYASLEPLPATADDQGMEIEDAFLTKIRHLASPRLSDADFDIEQLAKLAGMSRSQMFRKIKALTGKSPSVFIRDIRLQRGRELLTTTDMNVSQIAYEVGFSTPTYFSDAFLEAYGVRPSQFKA